MKFVYVFESEGEGKCSAWYALVFIFRDFLVLNRKHAMHTRQVHFESLVQHLYLKSACCCMVSLKKPLELIFPSR